MFTDRSAQEIVTILRTRKIRATPAVAPRDLSGLGLGCR
jgi:hypothetical protein